MLKNIYAMYREGFRSMTLGRTLWKVILVKLFIMFAILRTCFFPDVMASKFSSDAERSAHVLEQLSKTSKQPAATAAPLQTQEVTCD